MSHVALRRNDGVFSFSKPNHDGSTRLLATSNSSVADLIATDSLKPLNSFCVSLLTDMYQISMAYAYWKNKKHQEHAVFDLYFRNNPFRGEFSIFAGLEECLKFICDFKFTADQISYLRTLMPHCEEGFWQYLSQLDCSEMKVYALREGSLCFPKIPLLRLEGPLVVGQLIETPLLNLINFSTLIATNAARFRLAAGKEKTLLEFGLRRAQGPDGAISASRYSYIGGFDGTSNVLAGQLFGFSVKGTHAHAFVSAFTSDSVLPSAMLKHKQTGQEMDLLALAKSAADFFPIEQANSGELIAFVAFALAHPDTFLALIDTYNTLCSGLPNFLAVAYALHQCGYRAVGIRLDSGDLAYLSKETRKTFAAAAKKLGEGFEYFTKFNICASNDLNEQTILSLNQQGHEIDTFGVGTNLVTCQAQPALGAVYKLVEIQGIPRIKLSESMEKITLPGRKEAYRLYDRNGGPIFDVLAKAGGEIPEAGKKILCRHPFDETKRAFVTPTTVEPIHKLVWNNGKLEEPLRTLDEIKTFASAQIASLREDIVRALNPTPYKVSVTNELYEFFHNLWLEEAPIREFS
eukprot:TRINITY_DN5428_c0_g1_i1.p1 TRINITY_DN5428_c0_g1~~TRINITY_DN5428_c0_g1_i1.p1  ORF type:complete len:583 (+),score=215.95 TRINITY_DN5428_c0_g1_i1:22-1749(+)